MIINYLPFLSLSTEILLGHPYRLKRKRFFFFSSSNKRLCITKWHTKKKEHIDCNKTSLAKEIYQWYHSLIYESSHTCRMAWKYGTGAWLKIASLQIRQGWGGRRVWTPHFLYFVHIYNWLLPLSCGSHLLVFFFFHCKILYKFVGRFFPIFFVSWHLGNPTSCPLFSHLPWSAYPLYSQIPAPYICLDPQIRHHVQNVVLTHSYH